MNRNVTKKEIISSISSRTGLTGVDVKQIVECFLDTIVQSMMSGNNIEIRGFGRFKIRERQAHQAHNPRTGEFITVKAGVKPIFEASSAFKDILNKALKQKIIQKSNTEKK